MTKTRLLLLLLTIFGMGLGCSGGSIGIEPWPKPSPLPPAEKVKAIQMMLVHSHDPEVPEYHADEYRVTHWWDRGNMPAGKFGYPEPGDFECDGLARVEAWKNGKWLSTRWIFIKFTELGTAETPWGIRWDLVPKEYQ